MAGRSFISNFDVKKAQTYPDVREVERALLRGAWWIFPALGLIAPLLLGGPLWNWVSTEAIGPLRWSQLGRPLAWGGMFALLAIPLCWRLCLNRRTTMPMTMLFAVALVCAVDFGLRLAPVQAPLWLAARARLESDQSFMREVCYIRLEEAAGRADATPSVILMGSSQVLNGVDEQLLRRLIAPQPVIRRAVFGMSPLKAVAVSSYVPFRPGDTCFLYLSEFDFTNQDPFPYSWFRPFASWRVWRDVMESAGSSVYWPHWRGVIDYSMAATFELWQTRDFIRRIVFHFWRNEPAAQSAVTDLASLAAEAEKAKTVVRDAPEQWRAFAHFVRRLRAESVKLLIFEGDVNPELYSQKRLAAKQETMDALLEYVGPDVQYISRNDQNLGLTHEDWRDMTHLNAHGRELLTRRLATSLVAEFQQ